jgi:hypothetical protein
MANIECRIVIGAATIQFLLTRQNGGEGIQVWIGPRKLLIMKKRARMRALRTGVFRAIVQVCSLTVLGKNED